ncbi:MAG: DinB family protein [Chitinophagales bacterium]
MKIAKPNPDEYAPYYADYIAEVDTDNPIKGLKQSGKELTKLISSLSKKQLKHRYAEGKWSVKEIFAHLIDAERIFCYRALRFSRNDKTELPGFEENDYAPASRADERKIKSMLREFEALRNSTIQLFESFDEEMMMRTGSANKNPFSVRALVFIIIGHQKHHLGVIKERYLNPDYKPEAAAVSA